MLVTFTAVPDLETAPREEDERDNHDPVVLIERVDQLVEEQVGSGDLVGQLENQLQHLGEIVRREERPSNATEQTQENPTHAPQILHPGSAILIGRTEQEETTAPDAALAFFKAKQQEGITDAQVLRAQWKSYYALMITKETEGLRDLQCLKPKQPGEPAQSIITPNDRVHQGDHGDQPDSVANMLALLGDNLRLFGDAVPSETTAHILSHAEIYQFDKLDADSSDFQALMSRVLEPGVTQAHSHPLLLDQLKQSTLVKNEGGPDTTEAQHLDVRRIHKTPTGLLKRGHEENTGPGGRICPEQTQTSPTLPDTSAYSLGFLAAPPHHLSLSASASLGKLPEDR